MIKIITVYGAMLLTALSRTLLLALLGLFFACFIGMIFGIMGVLYVKWAIPGLFKWTSKMSSRKLLLIFIPVAVIFAGDILISYIIRPLMSVT